MNGADGLPVDADGQVAGDAGFAAIAAVCPRQRHPQYGLALGGFGHGEFDRPGGGAAFAPLRPWVGAGGRNSHPAEALAIRVLRGGAGVGGGGGADAPRGRGGVYAGPPGGVGAGGWGSAAPLPPPVG